MNVRFVLHQMSLLLLVLSGVLALIGVWSLGLWWLGGAEEERPAAYALLAAAGGGGLGGFLMWGLTQEAGVHLGRREAMFLVAASWMVGAALAAAPFFAWAHLGGDMTAGHPFRNAVDCYFEAMSGLTTTGATVLSDIERVPRSLLLWRSMTHWLGGLGIVVLFVAVLPSLGVGGKRLFRIEAPGPEPEGIRPQIRDTARVLWFIYLALTVAEVLALTLVGGMSPYDAVCHTFGTLATGGFSTRNASIGTFDSATVDVIVIVFMVLAGVNFALYYQIIRRRWRSVTRDVELRVYLSLLLIGSVLVVTALWLGPRPIELTTGEPVASSFGTSLREGVFTTVSIQTTTGYATSDFDQWPFLSKAILVMLMFVGGSAGSTSGGIKVIRIWIVLKVMFSELERAFRPNVIRPVRMGDTAIDGDLKLATLSYALGIVLLFAIGAGLIMLIEQFHSGSDCDFTTAATASLATLCTIGPGLAKVGAVENYGWFSEQSKLVMCLLMALGRLEVFAILVLFVPRFWSRD